MKWDVQTVAETASTNADVAAAARTGAPEGMVLVADHQTAGRGRLNRSWESPAGSGLAVSVLLRPTALPNDQWPWIPLMSGLAVADAIRALALEPRLKWPNDVEIDGLKMAGLLVERVDTSAGPAAIVGVGLNIAMTAEQLPIPTATSLHLQGVEAGRDDVLGGLLEALGRRYEQLVADRANLRGDYIAACGTVGSTVRVSLPDGSVIEGEATDIDDDGRLVVDGTPVTAGDVLHVRA